MQGKGLGALLALLLAATLLSGCGGGGEESGPGQSTAASAPANNAQQEVPPTAQKLRQGTQRVRAERRQAGQDETLSGEAQEAQKGSQQAQGTPKPQPPAAPRDTHRDSGGGAAQFRHSGGDNSIQESGTEASEAQLHAAAAVLHAYLGARVAHRWDEACFYLSAPAVALLEQFASRFGKGKGIQSCPEVLEALSEGASQGALEEAAKADAGSLRLEGGHGFLLYRGAGGVAYAIPVVSEGGAWKVGAVEGTAGV